jgi:hypothetical protein
VLITAMRSRKLVAAVFATLAFAAVTVPATPAHAINRCYPSPCH